MAVGERRTPRLQFNAETLPILKTDFNTVPDDGLLRSSRVIGGYFVNQLNAGSWVRVVDGDENSCVARIKKMKNGLYYLQPDWPSWRAAEEVSVSTSPSNLLTPTMQTGTSGEPVPVMPGNALAFT